VYPQLVKHKELQRTTVYSSPTGLTGSRSLQTTHGELLLILVDRLGLLEDGARRLRLLSAFSFNSLRIVGNRSNALEHQ